MKTTMKETIEEAAERIWLDSKSQLTSKSSFIAGAKSDAARDYWYEKFQEQDKKLYSEEDLREAFRQGHKSARMGSYNDITEQEDYNKWLKQFKKK
jgi:hypothetical protein